MMACFSGSDQVKNRRCYQFVIITAITAYCFLLMLFCTKASPLFAFHDWCDVNIYFTVGKGLFNGYVPYVDLIDAKGPFLYFLYGLAWFADNTGFFGVYVITSLCLAFSAVFVYRLAALFLGDRTYAFFAALFSPLPLLFHGYYAPGFDFGGGGPDEFTRAFIIAGMYYFALYFLKPEAYKLKHTCIQGALFACVLMLKANICAFWVGFLLACALDLAIKKQPLNIVKHMGCFLTGAILFVLPYLVYSVFTNSLDAFIYQYFTYNTMYTGAARSTSVLQDIKFGLRIAYIVYTSFFPFATASLLAGLAFFWVKGRKTLFAAGYTISFAALFAATYMSYVVAYSYLPLSALHVPVIIAAFACVKRLMKARVNKRLLPVIGAFVTVFAFIVTVYNNRLYRFEFFMTDRKTVQQQMADVIREHSSGEPTLLEVGQLDSGFYTALGIIPREPYFFIPHVAHEVFPYPRDAQERAVREARQEFVILSVRTEEADTENAAPPQVYGVEDNYDLIAVLRGTQPTEARLYFLYKRRDINI